MSARKPVDLGEVADAHRDGTEGGMSAALGREPEGWFRNFYRCETCGHEWEDEWSCQCDDECPACGARDMTPYRSEDIEGPSP